MHGGFSPPPRAPGAGVPRTSPAAVRLSSVNRETDELRPPRRQHRSFTKRSGLHAARASRHKGSVRLSGARHATCRRGVPGTFARDAAVNGVSDGRPAALSPGLRGGGRGLGAAGRRVVPAGRAQAPLQLRGRAAVTVVASRGRCAAASVPGTCPCSCAHTRRGRPGLFPLALPGSQGALSQAGSLNPLPPLGAQPGLAEGRPLPAVGCPPLRIYSCPLAGGQGSRRLSVRTAGRSDRCMRGQRGPLWARAPASAVSLSVQRLRLLGKDEGRSPCPPVHASGRALPSEDEGRAPGRPRSGCGRCGIFSDGGWLRGPRVHPGSGCGLEVSRLSGGFRVTDASARKSSRLVSTRF